MSRPKLLFLVACPATFAAIIPFLGYHGLDVVAQSLSDGIRPQYLAGRPEVVVIEHSDNSQIGGLEAASQVREIDSSVPIMIATTEGSEELVIGALRAGLQDYVKLPSSPASFLARIQKHLSSQRGRIEEFSAKPLPSRCSGRMVGASDSMAEIHKYLQKAAKSNCTVLITGETGTGKELVAEFIHENSPRRNKPFVCVNCAAIPESLLESELFGHTKGAFTGAQELTEGLLSAADGGTVFLDEVGDLSSVAQAKILRVLETKQFCRLGGTRQVHLDLRFVAATNQDLYAMTAQKAFRQDLFFRLDVAHVHLPPLRERKEDIPLLVQEFGRQFSHQTSGQALKFTDEFLRILLEYEWPGNVRELKNVIERLFLLELSTPLGAEHLPAHVRQFLATSSRFSKGERELLISALFSTKWNKTKAAEMLNWSRMTLYRKIAKYHIPENCPPRSV
jgi:DNA-binding NtrC family response regulator